MLPKVTLVNLSSHTSTFGPFARRLCTRFEYDKVVAMTSGTEAADTACKIARCWGINQKRIPAKDCVVLGVGDCYHGLASGVWGLMNSNPLRTTSEFSPPKFSRCILICDWERVCTWEPNPDEHQSQHGRVAGISRPGKDEILPPRA